jgi:hypothetical protein
MEIIHFYRLKTKNIHEIKNKIISFFSLNSWTKLSHFRLPFLSQPNDYLKKSDQKNPNPEIQRAIYTAYILLKESLVRFWHQDGFLNMRKSSCIMFRFIIKLFLFLFNNYFNLQNEYSIITKIIFLIDWKIEIQI